ncbi:MAG: hypothetical protein QXH67_00495 [Candidatus Bathyarchaeia archaeon]
MSEELRKIVYVIPLLFTAIMFADFFLAVPTITYTADTLKTWAVIISSMALGLGIVNLIRVHGNNIRRRTPGRWLYSASCLGVFFIMTAFGLYSKDYGPYKWLFTYAYSPLGQAMYTTTAFYIFSSAYRAFRARNIDAAILLISGVIVVLTNAPVGEVIFSGIPVVGRWLLDVGQAPTVRVFMMVAALGLLVYGFRLIIAKERGYLGEVAK